jgi:hypothetical protein
MSEFPLLNQLQFFTKQTEDVVIQRNLYYKIAITYVSPEFLEQELKQALEDPEKRREAHALFASAYQSLEDFVHYLVTQELEKHSRSTDQSN